MLEVTLPSAFLAGLLTFLAPCTLPLVPAYLAFLAGSAKPNESVVFKRALAFVLGFSTIIIGMGIFVSQLGRFVAEYRSVLLMVGGVLFAVFGASLLGLFQIPIQSKGLPASLHPHSNLAAYGLGVVFAFGWSPCVGPILGSIYVLAAQSGSSLFGTLLLTAFAIGHGVPFLFFAYFYEKSFKAIEFLSRYTEKINKGAGVILIVLGLFMIFGKYAYVVEFFRHILSGGWQEQIMNYL